MHIRVSWNNLKIYNLFSYLKWKIESPNEMTAADKERQISASRDESIVVAGTP